MVIVPKSNPEDNYEKTWSSWYHTPFRGAGEWRKNFVAHIISGKMTVFPL